VLIAAPPGSKVISECETGVPLPKACVASVRSDWQAYVKLESESVHGQADYLDPTDAFCHLGRCPAIVGTVPVYTDGVRMTDAFSASLAYLFAPYVGK